MRRRKIQCTTAVQTNKRKIKGCFADLLVTLLTANMRTI